MNRVRAARRLGAAAAIAALVPGFGVGWAAADPQPPSFHWSRLDASIDVSSWSAGQVSGVIRVWGAHAFSHLDDSPAARAIGSPMDIGVLATAANIKGVAYPLTSESLSPGGADNAEFSGGSRSVPGVIEAQQLFSSAKTVANPPSAVADGGGQSAKTPAFTVSNYRASSKLADSGKGTVAGSGVVSVDGIVVGPLAVQNVTTLVESAADGTEAGSKMAARTVVTGATVNGVPVEIGSSGVTAADQQGGADGVGALNEQIQTALKAAGVFEVFVAQPKTTSGSGGTSIDAGGLRVRFVPTPEMSGAVNAAVPVEAAFASGRGNVLAVSGDGDSAEGGDGGAVDGGFGGGVVEPEPSGPGSFEPVGGTSGQPTGTSSGPALPGGFDAPLTSSAAGARVSSGVGTSPGVSAGGPGPGGGTEVSSSPATSGDAAAPVAVGAAPPSELQAQPVRASRPSDRPWVAALAVFSAAVLVAMIVAARRAAARALPSGLRQAMETLTGGAS